MNLSESILMYCVRSGMVILFDEVQILFSLPFQSFFPSINVGW